MPATMTSIREERVRTEVRRYAHAGLTAHELLRRVARALSRAAPFDLYSAATIDPASNLITSAFAARIGGDERERPVNPAWFEHFYFAEGYEQTIALARRGQWATTLVDETRGHLDASLCYRESMRPAGVEHKAHAVFVDRVLWGDLELYREAGEAPFSEREIELIRRIAPDVGAGLKAATLRAQSAADEADDTTPGVLIVDRRGQVTATAPAERLLGELSDRADRWHRGSDLPAPVHVVLGALRQALAPRSSRAESAIPRLQVRGRSGRWLSLHASSAEAAQGQPGEEVVIIAPARPRDVVWLGMSAYGLSPREEEVVKLVVGGLSTRQIADRLFIAEHTVQRHLSNIFEKVGVRGRRALVKQLFVEQVLPAMN